MASTPEGRVKKGVRDLLSGYRGMYLYMPVPTGYGRTSLDFIGCFRGRFFAIETKTATGKLTMRQIQTISEMRSAGAKVFVVSGEGGVPLMYLKAWLEHVDKATPYDPGPDQQEPKSHRPTL